MADTGNHGKAEQDAASHDQAGAAGPAASEHAAGPPQSGEQSGAQQDVPSSQLRDIIAVLQTELDTARGERMRLLADMDNVRKRAEREKADTAKFAITKFAQDIVGVVDNFERAASAVSPDAADKDPTLKSFLGGVVLAEREFLAVLERHGVKRIEAQGQPFNPHQHQAVMEREDTSVPAGTVLQVFQPGFMIDERCLRPAMVVVSTGGARSARSASAEQPPPTPPPQQKPATQPPEEPPPGGSSGGSMG